VHAQDGRYTIEGNQMNFRAALLRYAELSRSALTQLMSWGRGRGLNHNPSTQVATATNANGEVVCHCTIEPCYMVASAPNPLASEQDRYLAGEVIEDALVSHAQLKGMSRMLIVVPDGFPSEPEERWIRIVERKVPQIAVMHGVGCFAPSPAAYIN
jgi:hypothetical protein